MHLIEAHNPRQTMKSACHLHFPILRKLRGPPSPLLPLGGFFMIRSQYLYHVTHRLLHLGRALHNLQQYNSQGLQCKWHPRVVQYTTCTTWCDGPNCTQRQSGNSKILFQPLIGWVRSTLILLLSNNTAVKTETNETPKRICISIFPITLNMHSSPTWVPICIILSSTEIGVPLGSFLPSFTCYPGIIGLKLITGSLIMEPIDSVFQLREAIKNPN